MRRKLKEIVTQRAMARRMSVDFHDRIETESTWQDLEISRELIEGVRDVRQLKKRH
ncbi:hypothetical protein J2S00_002321 [Caldalkalibacillus uzonensis]|uniref:FbpB family small basic protein n=1 Tax=Caldalkalibacillus uzonensis TaxID=353224 RepID=A0ABU0CSZ1_9BACI|nr:hypothetical protein [Caldalkalibacillus uzonensis]MDQ0339533.1 hypothetical protein [Caldalkalibacillus uzonensis]